MSRKPSALWRLAASLPGLARLLAVFRPSYWRRLGQARLVAASGLFDRDWYCRRYPDVAASGQNPLVHFLTIGAREGRDPGPAFRTRGYLEANPDVAESGMNALLHYILHGRAEGRSPDNEPLTGADRAGMAGRRPTWKSGAITVLVCAHNSPARLFGGERSFLDIVQGLNRIGANVVVAVPSAPNKDYVELLHRHCVEVEVVPYRWWSGKEPLRAEVVSRLEEAISKHSVDVVHVNTLMLMEPLVAARASGIPGVVHVRELVRHDPDLCAVLAASPDEIVQRVVAESSAIIANSATTAKAFDLPGRTWVVPNCVDPPALDLPPPGDVEILSVGLISSNLPKKGISDFAAVAEQAAIRQLPMEFLLFGPINDHVRTLLKTQERRGGRPNLYAAGYVSDPRHAMARVDVVVSLSHFQESFGRTVLEAMAARRAVVAYDWGAVSELIDHGRNGLLVPFRDTRAVLDALCDLQTDRLALRAMAEAGRVRAVERYSPLAYARQLYQAYSGLLNGDPRLRMPDASLPERSSDRSVVHDERPPTISVVIPNFNYADFLPERIASIGTQTLRPAEILFLDDCSSDDSVALAEELLQRTGIPYRIVVNSENQGVYRQWLRGIAEASGEYVWIAEADDTADPRLLERLAVAMRAPSVVLAYAQSRVLDEQGREQKPNLRHHTDGVDPAHWASDYVEMGAREVVDYLGYRNTIPNVSACLFDREALAAAADGLDRFRYCGDWYLYCRMLRGGSVAFVAEALNGFRRHAASVTRIRGREIDYLEELIEVKRCVFESFPIHLRQIDSHRHFIDRDYRIESLTRNSAWEGYRRFEHWARGVAQRRARFALVTTNDGSHDGGSEMLWIEAAQRLWQAGHDVVVVLRRWDPEPPFMSTFRRLGIRAYHREDAFEAITRFQPDLLVLSLGDQDEGVDWYAHCAVNKTAYVVVNQLTKSPEVWPIRKNRQRAIRKGYARALRVFFTCDNNHRLMELRLGCRLPNAEIHFNPLPFDRSVDMTFPPITDTVRVAVPARLHRFHKAQHLIIEALARPRWRQRSIIVTFYGDGPDRESLERQAHEQGVTSVRFVDRVADMTRIWSENHAILLASRMEGLPIVLIGAMICARVPILTDVGGHRELVSDGDNGFIAAEASVDCIDEVMERAWQRRQEWEAIGHRARARILGDLPEDPVGDFVSRLEGCLRC